MTQSIDAGGLDLDPAGRSFFVPLYKKPWAKLGLIGLAGLSLASWLLLGVLRDKPDRLPEGEPGSWSTFEAKQALADALNRGVKLPGFKAWVHKVGRGENYWGLAKEAGVNIDTLVGVNPELRSLQAYLGRALLMVNRPGAIALTRSGDSAAAMESAHGLSKGSLRATNRFGAIGMATGKLLFLPGAKPKPLSEEMRALYAQREVFRSPLKGRYTSLVGVRFDPFTGDAKHHNGVDIKAPFNDLVAAAAEGVVLSAGWNGGLGKAVRLRHAGGYETVYGHLNSILVKPGQTVKQHQFIARVGATGRTTGPHLHFTIYKNGKVQDPLKYLW